MCSVSYDQYENIMSYNDIKNHIAEHEDEDIVQGVKCIVSH